jgi:hypothetical protein
MTALFYLSVLYALCVKRRIPCNPDLYDVSGRALSASVVALLAAELP